MDSFLRENHLLRSWDSVSLLKWIWAHESIKQLYMEDYCQADSRSCYLDMLDKLKKRVCKTVGPILAASLEPLPNCKTAEM